MKGIWVPSDCWDINNSVAELIMYYDECLYHSNILTLVFEFLAGKTSILFNKSCIFRQLKYFS